MKRFRIFSKKTIIAGSVIFVSFLFILMAFSPALAGTGQQTPQAITEKSYIPNPTLNTNISWSAYNSTWAPMQYWNGTGYQNLSAGYSTYYKNPIAVDTGDIVANGTLQNDKVAGGIWNTVSPEAADNSAGLGAVATAGTSTIGGVTEPYITLNTSAAGAAYTFMGSAPTIQVSELPSNNLAYDYITYGATFTGANITGAMANLVIYNGTTNTFTGLTIYPGQSVYASMSLAYLQQLNGGKGFNTTGSQAATKYWLQPHIVLPQTTTNDVFKLTVNAIAITQYPYILGENSTGAPVNIIKGEAHLSKFNPTIPMEVLNNGYSVAVSQEMTNTTESQASISDGNYIEEATYQGTLTLPTAPDLSYRTANVSLNMTLPGSQYEVATLNGISYLKGVQASNSTYSFGIVNPNTPNSMILEAKYTASQWDSSTHAPSFFTLRGLEYYWWVGVIGGLSIIGLGAAAVSHFGGDEEDLKIPKGKFGR